MTILHHETLFYSLSLILIPTTDHYVRSPDTASWTSQHVIPTHLHAQTKNQQASFVVSWFANSQDALFSLQSS
jgi:hypothetical protein